ncbi:MAG: DUF2378 family protein [Polyangiaceae bacterium]|nr:DUF2378 family protein [Polyangiaceae bacterium]
MFLTHAASAIYPHVPPRKGVRRIGKGMYPAFANSALGKAALGFGTSLERALRIAPTAYSLAGTEATANLVSQTAGRAVVELRGVWDNPDCFEVGV